jgi:Flp pilus assembly protein TadD
MARATRQAGDLAAAIVIYRSLVANTSVQPEVKVEFGDALLESGAPDDAIDIYSQVGAQSPARLAALLGMTRAWLDLGDPAKALEQADAARRLAPEDARVLVDRGVVLDSLERHAEAQQSYRAVLAVVPRHVSARNNLALSLALTGQFDEAIALMAPLVRSSAATPRVRGNMAVIYALKGDTEDAATMSKVDLDDSATRANLAFLAAARDPGP